MTVEMEGSRPEHGLRGDTPPPPPSRPQSGVSRRALITYMALAACLAAVKLFFDLVPSHFPGADQATAFTWPVVFGVVLTGLAGLYLAPCAGFPDMWDPLISNRQRLLLPIADGVVYGVITVLRDLAQPSDVHLPFPASLPFYAFGAIFLEILLRLFGVTVITALLRVTLFRWRWQAVAFWIGNVTAALYEPWPFLRQNLAVASHLGVPGVLVDWLFQPLFLANVLTGYLYRRYGFFTAIVLRLAFYLVWHVAYGGFRPFWLSF